MQLAATLGDDDLEQAVVEADIRRLARPLELRDVLVRKTRARGRRRLERIVERAGWQGLTRSQAERRFRRLMARAGLGPLRVNPLRHDHRLDFVFDAAHVVIEIDGFATHGRRAAFERDHRRDAALELRGWHVLRFSARQLSDEPERVVATVATVTARVA